jgi:hypothetical protein
VTFKDLQKVIQAQSPLISEAFDDRTLNRLRVHGRGAFWYWDKKAHKERDMASKGDCCFNHIIGLPRKDGVEMPLFDYEREIFYGLVKPGYYNSYPYSHADLGLSSSGRTKYESYRVNNILHPFKEKHLWIKKATGLGVTDLCCGLWLGCVFAMTIIEIARCAS